MTNTYLQDDLTFSIPAGSYPSGLSAVARVHVSGSVGASVGADPTTQLVRFTALVESHSSTPGEVAQSASSDISGALTCIDVPSSITWLSDSGVFGAPRCSEPLPTPSLMGGALAGLVLALIGSGLWIAHGSKRGLA